MLNEGDRCVKRESSFGLEMILRTYLTCLNNLSSLFATGAVVSSDSLKLEASIDDKDSITDHAVRDVQHGHFIMSFLEDLR